MRDLLACLLLCSVLFACAPQGMDATKYVDGMGKSGLTGTLFTQKDRAPLANAYVNIYPRNVPNLLGPSQYISPPSADDGSYAVEVPPGDYYVVARKRSSGMATGPLAPGDFFSEDARKLVTIRPGKLAKIDLPMINMSAPMFFKRDMGDLTTDTGIKGVLVDAKGEPIAGGFAIAYVDANIRRLPDFVSTLTDAEGRFTLYLPKGGEYYLAARIHAWDMPKPGELYGTYGQLGVQPLKVDDKQFVSAVKIVMVPFTGPYKEGMSQRPF